MHKFIIQRILILIPVIFGVMFIVFSIMAMTPGDPGRQILGPNARQEEVDKLNQKFGYDKPFIERFFRYVSGAVKGDFGLSYSTQKPVFKSIFERLPTTALLAFLAVTTAIMIGLPLGILSAVRQYSYLDLMSTLTAMLLAAVPEFWLGIMLILLFGLKFKLVTSFGIVDWTSFILPTLTLALPASAAILRLTRATMLETIRQDYIRTARSKGAPEKDIIWTHALKNALIPVVTIIGAYFGGLFGGTILTESIFSIPGLGLLTLDAIYKKDIPQVMASVIFLAVIFCIIMMLVDIIQALIDPRVRARYLN